MFSLYCSQERMSGVFLLGSSSPIPAGKKGRLCTIVVCSGDERFLLVVQMRLRILRASSEGQRLSFQLPFGLTHMPTVCFLYHHTSFFTDKFVSIHTHCAALDRYSHSWVCRRWQKQMERDWISQPPGSTSEPCPPPVPPPPSPLPSVHHTHNVEETISATLLYTYTCVHMKCHTIT